MQIQELHGRWVMPLHGEKPVIALRTDFRRVGHHEHVNLMLEQSSSVVTMTDQLLVALHAPLLSGPDA